MTNIINIVLQLNKDGHKIDMVISEGHIFIAYGNDLYDITTMSFSDQISLIASILDEEVFG